MIREFIEEYAAKHGRMPSHFAPQVFEGHRLLAQAMKVDDMPSAVPNSDAVRNLWLFGLEVEAVK